VTFTMPAKAVNVTATYENIPVPTYAVTVTDGTGGGEFAEGAAVTITADTPAEGKRFAGWTGLEGLTLTNGSAATESVTFTMPAKAVNVTAAYEDIPVVTYAVTVPNGSGGGEFAEGAAVTITADTPAEGKRFAGWTGLEGLTITNGSAATETVTFIMPAKAVNVTATYEDIPAPQLPVITSPTAPQTVTVPLGQKGGMGVEAENADSFQWYVDRNDGAGYVAIRGADSAEYTTSEVTKLNDGYTYYCQVTNAAGSVNSPVFTLKVQEPIVIPPTGDSAPVGLWLLMLSAAAVMMFTLLKRKPCDN